MKIGTKSLLFGCHQFMIHPYYVYKGWLKLYSRPNWKEFICIIVHDWGYWGCADMDGKEGSSHSIYGAYLATKYLHWVRTAKQYIEANKGYDLKYHNLCILHSASFADKQGEIPSKLCWADKYATLLIPDRLWLFLAKLSSELSEYMDHEQNNKLKNISCPYEWKRELSKLIMLRIAHNVNKKNGAGIIPDLADTSYPA
jgi:hypothetical protein